MTALLVSVLMVAGYFALLLLVATVCGTNTRTENTVQADAPTEPAAGVRDPETGRVWVA